VRSEGPKKVALLPLRLNSEGGMPYLRDGLYDMLASRLFVRGSVDPLSRQAVMRLISAAPVGATEVSLRDLGRRLGADIVVHGSATLLGESASFDLTALDVKSVRPAQGFFDQAGDGRDLLACIDRLAVGIRSWVLERPEPMPPAAAAAASPAEPQATERQRHPEKVFEQEYGRTREAPGTPRTGPSGSGVETAAAPEAPPLPAAQPAADRPAVAQSAPVEPPAPESSARREAKAWTVQVLAERREEEALRSAEILTQKGFPARVESAEVPGKGLWYRVRTGGFDSRAAAAETLERLRRLGFAPVVMPTRSGP
jgi:cell division septation protein DedD